MQFWERRMRYLFILAMSEFIIIIIFDFDFADFGFLDFAISFVDSFVGLVTSLVRSVI